MKTRKIKSPQKADNGIPVQGVESPATPQPLLKNTRMVTALWYLAAGITFWSFGYTMMRGSDLWWHIATGRLIYESRSLPLVDSWSFTRQGQPWLQHEWLADFIYQIWGNLFGVSSLVYWKWLMVISTFGLLLYTIRRWVKDPLSSYLAVLFGIATATPFLDIRPHLYSLLGFALLLFFGLPKNFPRFLPLLFLVWVNLHGGFFFGLLVLVIILGVEIYKTGLVNNRKPILIFASCVIACFLNPNGLRAFTYPLKYAFDKNSPFAIAIDEWQSPFQAGGIHSLLYPYMIGVFILSGFFILVSKTYRKEKGLPVAELLLGLLTLMMSLTSRRFIPLLAMAQSLVVAPVMAYLFATQWQKVPQFIFPTIATLIGFLWLAPYPHTARAFHYLVAEDNFPVETCNFIETNQLEGKVFAYFNWGGYLHYRTKGRMKVFIDGRADTVFDDQTLIRYSMVQGFRQGWEDIIESSGAQYILFPRNQEGKPLAQLISSGRWRLLYDDAVSVLLVRATEAPLPQIQATGDSAYKRLASGIRNLERQAYAEAEKDLQSALELQADLRLAGYSLVQTQLSAGEKEKARASLNHCQKLFPDSQMLRAYEKLLP
ncbi:MAG: hypothetical protein AB1757_06365 [Acidobacteriota bacterium]